MTPEKRIFNLLYKLLVSVISISGSFFTAKQVYEYIFDDTSLNFEIYNSEISKDKYISFLRLNNNYKSIQSSDLVHPIIIVFNKKISQVLIDSVQKNKYAFDVCIRKDTLKIKFDLLNKGENINFRIVSNEEVDFRKVEARIKDVNEVLYFNYKTNPTPLNRILNFWLIILFVSIFLFIDALLIISKDIHLGKIKKLIFNYPLDNQNKLIFFDKLRDLYLAYPIRFKLPVSFVLDRKIKNLLNEVEISSINVNKVRYLINKYLEISFFYRFRILFIVLAPIFFLISILGLIFNFYYYSLQDFISYPIEVCNSFLINFASILLFLSLFFNRGVIENKLVRYAFYILVLIAYFLIWYSHTNTQ